jgi:tetrahydromethanopterin S-methyltransferase subunit B
MVKEREDTLSELSQDEYLLPSRSIVHSTVKGKLTRLFYTTIVTLFILLILTLIGLFLYHNKI